MFYEQRIAYVNDEVVYEQYKLLLLLWYVCI